MIYIRFRIFKLVAYGAVLLTFQLTVTLAAPPTDEDCTDDVPFPDPEDCTSYYQCFDVPGMGWVVVPSQCPPGGYYDDASKSCVAGECPTDQPPTELPTTPGPPVFTCPTAGFYSHPTDPQKYYQCVLIGGRFYYYIYTCPLDACFQQSTRTCVIGSCPNATAAAVFRSVTSATQTGQSPDYPCHNPGYFNDPVECNSYYRCILISGQMYPYTFHCPVRAFWSQTQQSCIEGTCSS